MERNLASSADGVVVVVGGGAEVVSSGSSTECIRVHAATTSCSVTSILATTSDGFDLSKLRQGRTLAKDCRLVLGQCLACGSLEHPTLGCPFWRAQYPV